MAGVRKRLGSLLGPEGRAPQLSIGTTTQVDAGAPAELSLVKTGEAAYRVDAQIPKGIDGDPTAVANFGEAFAAEVNTEGTPGRAALNAQSVDAVEEGGAARPVVETIADRATAAAAERFFTVLRQETRDASAVVVGDSTGDAPYRWPREYALLVASAFPRWGVKYGAWNAVGRAWNTVETIQAGTNGRTVTLWNASVSGGASYTHQAPDADRMITSRDPDVVFINDGHNEGSPAWTSNNTRLSFQARYVALCEDVRRRVPAAGIVCIGQNPPQTGIAHMADKTQVIKTVAAQRGYGIADTTQAFIDAGVPSSLYEGDLLHPNAAGGKLQANTIWQSTYSPRPVSPATQPASIYTDPPAENLLLNGDFSTLDAVTNVPTGWAATRTTVAKDTTNYENARRGYALRLTSTGGGQAFLYQAVLNGTNIAQWRGRYLTLLVRLRNNAAAPDGVAGRISLLDGTQVVDGLNDPHSFGGFVWRALTFRVSDAATMLQARIYCDYGTLGTSDVTVDGAWLTEGTLPRKARD